ncbi:conserved hypothetical protein [Ricinus communis]|uniref:Uncharacterized protein n=1 Tax=Ricinus communis TaxID=3988 RepID=B9RQA3_RICCO|nr:conserved hypothetical protein [Ricinus communis]
MAMTAANYQMSLTATILIFVMVLPLMVPPGDAARLAHQGLILKEEPMCPQCTCCSAPPPGSCCKCCTASVQPLDSSWP